MLDTHVESLLQEIATEMAFLSPGRSQGMDTLMGALENLAQEPGTVASADAQQEIAWSLSLCQQALNTEIGLTREQQDGLQASYERLTNALYLAKP